MYITDQLHHFRMKIQKELESFTTLSHAEGLMHYYHLLQSNESRKTKLDAVIVMYLIWLSELVKQMEKNPRYSYKETIESILRLPFENLTSKINIVDEICKNFINNEGIFSSCHGKDGIYRSHVDQLTLGDIAGNITNWINNNVLMMEKKAMETQYRKYWMHRISYERDVKEILLNEDNLLVTGWGKVSTDAFLNKVYKKDREGYNQIYKQEFGQLSRNRFCLYMFINEFKKGDYVIVPGDKDFSVYQIVGERVCTKEHLHLSIKSTSANQLIDYRNDRYFNKKTGDELELGFFWEVQPIELNISRDSYADNILRQRLKFQMTNIEMTDLSERIEKAIKDKRNGNIINVYAEISNNVRGIILKNLTETINDSHLERVVKWYVDRIGATKSYIPAKNTLSKDKGDADVIALFDDLRVMLVIQVKQYTDSVGKNDVEQVVKAFEYYDEKYPEYTSLKWLVSTCKSFTDEAAEIAENENVRLINGDEFSQMILDAGIKDMNVN